MCHLNLNDLRSVKWARNLEGKSVSKERFENYSHRFLAGGSLPSWCSRILDRVIRLCRYIFTDTNTEDTLLLWKAFR